MAPITSLCAGRPGYSREKPVHFSFPLNFQAGLLASYSLLTAVSESHEASCERAHARSPHPREGCDFVCVKLCRIAYHEPDLWILKCGHRGGGEIGVARADARPDPLCAPTDLRPKSCGAMAPTDANGPRAANLCPPASRLPGSCLRNKFVERIPGLAHQHAAPPATISGLLLERMASTARCRETSSGCPRRINTHACGTTLPDSRRLRLAHSCGSASVTAPQSEGEVSTRIAQAVR